MLLDRGGRKRARHEAEPRGFLAVHLVDELGNAHHLELLARHPGVAVARHVLPSDLIPACQGRQHADTMPAVAESS